MKAKLLAATLLAGALCAAVAAAETKCVLQSVGELPLTFEDSRVLVDASVNGTLLELVVDTGAEGTTLYRETADKLGLRAKQIGYGLKMYGVGGSDILSEAGVKELKVGGLVARNINLAVSGHQHSDIAGGLLGAGFLFQTDVEFDIPEGKLRFFKSTGCSGDQVVYWGKAYSVASNVSPNPDLSIQIVVKLGDTPIRATMDSGSYASVVDEQAAQRYANHTIAPEAAGLAYGIGKETVQEAIAVFPSFSFGDETIKNARLRVANLFHADQEVELGSRIAKHVFEEPQMMLGADFFRAHRVYISQAQKKIYASYMGGPVFDTRAPTQTPAPVATKP